MHNVNVSVMPIEFASTGNANVVNAGAVTVNTAEQ